MDENVNPMCNYIDELEKGIIELLKNGTYHKDSHDVLWNITSDIFANILFSLSEYDFTEIKRIILVYYYGLLTGMAQLDRVDAMESKRDSFKYHWLRTAVMEFKRDLLDLIEELHAKQGK